MSSINSSSESVGKFNTKDDIEKDNFIWTIEKFSSCELLMTKNLKSPIFSSKNNNFMKWYLSMYLEVPHGKEEEYVSFSLNLEGLLSNDITALCSFYILSASGEKKHGKVMSIKKFNKKSSISFLRQFVNCIFLHSNDNNELLPNDSLTIGCEIFYYYGTINSVPLSTRKNKNDSVDLLLDDIAGMLESSKFTDCVIKVGNCEIYVHKCILANRSEVFDLILSDKQCESNPNIIEVNGFRLEVVKEMITYMYTGKSPNMYKMAYEMLEIAKKYKLERLKLMAEESLLYSLAIENACDYLVHSELYSGEILKGLCLRFIYLNAEDIVNTEEWKKIVIDYPLLVAKLFNIAVNVD